MKRKRSDIVLDLWKKYVKERDDYTCRRCGRSKPDVQIHAHHVISSTNWNLRFDPENGVALCASCHWHWFHGDDPFDYPAIQDWYKKNVNYDYLEGQRYKTVKNDYPAIIDAFKKTLEGNDE